MQHSPDITLRDTMYEPGSYQCRCVECGQLFIGHKRALDCLECAEKWVAKYNSWTQEERAAFREKQDKEVEAFFRDEYQKLFKR